MLLDEVVTTRWLVGERDEDEEDEELDMHEEETEPDEERERELDGSMRWWVTLWTCCCEMLTSLMLLLIWQSIENKV